MPIVFHTLLLPALHCIASSGYNKYLLLLHRFTLSDMEPFDTFEYADPISPLQILFLVFLKFVIEPFCSGLGYIFLLCIIFLLYLCKSCVVHRNTLKRLDAAAATCTPSVWDIACEAPHYREMPMNDSRARAPATRERDPGSKLSIGEVKVIIEALDHELTNTENPDLNTEIEELFEEEPSLEEIKEAFDLFDENADGFIDAEDLKKVLSAMGFTVALKVDECRKMIKAYDSNGDGRLDFGEFAKLIEESFF